MATGVGVVGLGFISQMHRMAYSQVNGVKVVALCDVVPSQRAAVGKKTAGNIEAAPIKGEDLDAMPKYASMKALLADPNVDAVSICTPTHTHVKLAVDALRAGKHVLCEKPLAPTSKEAAEFVRAAKKSRCVAMVAQCIRFWPEYAWLKQAVDTKLLGKLRSLTLLRLSATPTWSVKSWILNPRLSGSAALDLHIHDSDFAYYLLGKPRSVISLGTTRVTRGGVDHIVTQYRYGDKKLQVTAEGGWCYDEPFGFRMEYHAVFENGSVDFCNGELRVFKNNKQIKPKLAKGDGYVGEVTYFVDCIRKGVKPAIATPTDGMRSVALVEAEIASVRKAREVKVT